MNVGLSPLTRFRFPIHPMFREANGPHPHLKQLFVVRNDSSQTSPMRINL